jgi:DNA replication and repair protein RecF
MPITHLQAHNLRLFSTFRLVPDKGLNVVVGPNASGKTTVLEAIYLLGTGRSFRTLQLDQAIRKGQRDLLVTGGFEEKGIPETHVGVKKDDLGRQVSISGERQEGVAALVRLIPLQLIAPDSHYQFFLSSRQRRAALDWGLFHVEPAFHGIWSRYQRALSQRNAALKQRQGAASSAWDEELSILGESLYQARSQFVQEWNAEFVFYGKQILNTDELTIQLRRGWGQEDGLRQALIRDREKDRLRGVTHSGAHRADVEIQFQGGSAKLTGSHGQQKLLVAALRLAQLKIYERRTGRRSVVLVDDLAAELDPERRHRLLAALSDLGLQVFITATERHQIDTSTWSSHQVFHVERFSDTPTDTPGRAYHTS